MIAVVRARGVVSLFDAMRAAFDGVEHHAVEMLLELYIADRSNRSLSVSAVASMAGRAPTTGLRSISKMEEAGFIERHADKSDGRRTWVVLTDLTRERLQNAILS